MTANRRHRARRLRRRFLVDRDSGHARGASASLAGQHRIAPHIDEVGVPGRFVAGEAFGLVVLSHGLVRRACFEAAPAPAVAPHRIARTTVWVVLYHPQPPTGLELGTAP